MNVFRHIIALTALFAAASPMNAQLSLEVKDSVAGSDTYNPELGYFQKAHSDIGDPRFMITDKDGTFTIGIGGTVHASTFYDFDGAINSSSAKFNIYKLFPDTDNAKQFGLDAVNSELHVKAKTQIGKHSIIAYIQMSANDDEVIKLSKAYVSFDGLTIGRVYSFFMDLEAGPRTVDMTGPCSQINSTQPLVGFTLPLNKHLTLAASAEKPEIKAFTYENYGIVPDYQSVPDFVVKAHYRWNTGHVQLAGLWRRCSWWNTGSRQTPTTVTQGETETVDGYGMTLSGNLRPCKKLELSAQGYIGKGISKYVNAMSDLQCDLIPSDWNPSTGMANSMKTPLVKGGYVSAGYHWTNKLSSYIVAGYSHLDLNTHDLTFSHSSNGVRFKSALYAAANLFYDINDFCKVGIEGNYGTKTEYDTTADGISNGWENTAHASRITGTFIYQF